MELTMDGDALHHERRWSALAPPLIHDPGFPVFTLPASDQARIAQLPRSAATLPHRLGRRFEAHWEYTFTHLPGWTVHAAGLQLREGRRTVGELDLLVSDHQTVWHLELAVKFYLCIRGRSGDQWDHWIGPNARDRLDRKLARMRTHQLPMGRSAAAMATLARQQLPPPDHSAAILRGIRFADWQAPRADAAGLWCREDELPAALNEARVLRRTQWLGFAPATDDAWRSGHSLYATVSAQLARGAVQLVDRSGRRWLVVTTPLEPRPE